MASNELETDTRTVKAVETACDIIDFLQENDGAGVTELSNELDVSKSAIHTHLGTLRKKQYVTKEGTNYRASLKFLDLGEYVKNRIPIYDVVQNEIEKLAEEQDLRAQFVVEEHGVNVCVCIARGARAVVPATRVGERSYLHCTAAGKAILAFTPAERIERILDQRGLPKRTNNTITDRDELYAELEDVRERRVAFNDEEKLQGLRAVGVPICGSDGEIHGAVSVSGTTSKLEAARFTEELPDLVGNAANVIEITAQIEERDQL